MVFYREGVYRCAAVLDLRAQKTVEAVLIDACPVRSAVEAAKAGISANDYAEQAVSFGAALKEAFSGDVSKAATAANTAIMDMTDNAAKMGTPIENIQTALTCRAA